MRSSPEEAIPKIEALLDSRDPRERAEGYRLVGRRATRATRRSSSAR